MIRLQPLKGFTGWVDHRAYPPAALREALLNAIVHRDYAYSASTLISVDSDRIEIRSVGGLVPDFHLNDVYTVGILNFIFPGDEYDKDCFHHEVKLIDVEDKHVFYDKLTYVYLEMPKFNKTEEELVSMYDKWLFVLKNLTRLMERPTALQERVFTRLFEQAEIARFTPDESRIYEESLKQYRDMRNTIASAKREGREEGRIETNRENARKMKELKIAIDVISQVTGLSNKEIESL